MGNQAGNQVQHGREPAMTANSHMHHEFIKKDREKRLNGVDNYSDQVKQSQTLF